MKKGDGLGKRRDWYLYEEENEGKKLREHKTLSKERSICSLTGRGSGAAGKEKVATRKQEATKTITIFRRHLK